jgi:hypothetical protein
MSASRHKLPLPLNEFGQVGESFYGPSGDLAGFYSYRQMHRCEFCKILLSYANVDKIMQNFA